MTESGPQATLTFPDCLSDILAAHWLFMQSPFPKACSEPWLLKIWIILNYCVQTVEMTEALGLLHTRTPLQPRWSSTESRQMCPSGSSPEVSSQCLDLVNLHTARVDPCIFSFLLLIYLLSLVSRQWRISKWAAGSLTHIFVCWALPFLSVRLLS